MLRLHTLLALVLCAAPLAAQGTPTERVLIVGDSWAELTWTFNSLDDAFAWAGHADMSAVGDVTAISGSTAAQWNQSSFQMLIQQELAAHPTVDVIHLNIGGNDFLGAWSLGMSQAQEQALFQQIATDVEGIILFLHGIDPNLQIVYSGYDYLNMVEMLQFNFFDLLLWLSLGSPTPEQLNRALVRSSLVAFRRLQADPTVHFVNHTGLMQWVFGYPSLGIAPRSLPLPGHESNGWQPLVGGDPLLPSPPEAMLDAIHLNPVGFDAIGRHCTIRFYDAWFDAHP